MLKKILGIFVCLILLSSTASSWAMQLFNQQKIDLLLERLQKKGILSPEEVQEIKSQEEENQKKHSINMSIRLQFRYEYREGDESNNTERLNEMEVRRLRLCFDGDMWPELDYKFEIAADRLGDLSFKDVWLKFTRLGPYAELRLGQFKTPFSRQRIASSGKLQMIDRSPIQLLYPGRDTGLELAGQNILGVFDYAIAMEAGWGDKKKYSSTDNSEFWYDGRFVFHPLGPLPLIEGDITHSEKLRFELAGNVLYAPGQVAFGERSIHDMFLAADVYGIPALTDVTTTTLSALPPGLIGDTLTWGPDFTIFYQGFSLTGEYYLARYTPNDTTQFRKLHSRGCFLQAGVFIIPKTLEITARYDRLDRNTKTKSQDDTQEYSIGINCFISKDHRYKLQANYIWRDEDRDEIDNNSLVLNLQAKY